MKKILNTILMIISISLVLGGCTANNSDMDPAFTSTPKVFEGAVNIVLSDDMITVDGEEISKDSSSKVYTANDIVYYEEGKDFTYGEGTEEDAHSIEEAQAHTVVYITEPGTYALSGKLSAGQIAVDLGDDAEENPDASVTLILNGVDITCTVAPAVIFYNVYECGSTDEEAAQKDVDTSAAGANVMIADGTVNNISGSYVARIYNEGTIELNEEGTEVLDAKKLHKYDAAFYSKMSMNVNGDTEGTGILNIDAENEGLDSELHLTINGGNINIVSGNDGINTNEDYVSVTTINGGIVNITVDGKTGEGDGIDSNGWLVINGGTVIASACAFSGDAGIDSDMGIHINGGTVIASGNMLDRISESSQNYAVFTFSASQKAGSTYTLKDTDGNVVAECTPMNDFSILILSSADLEEGTYTLWMDDVQLSASSWQGGMGFGGGMMRPQDMPENMEIPEGMQIPERAEFPEGEMPEGMERPEGEGFEGMKRPEGELPENMEIPGGEMPEGMERPEGMQRPNDNFQKDMNTEASIEFVITQGGSYFSNVSKSTE